MYAKYHTDALVLATRERGEADKECTLYTADFGLVRARAAAVRLERSRMRAALQLFSHAHVSLVRGKRGWRAAGALALSTAPAEHALGLAAFTRIALLVERLVRGEERNEYIYRTLAEARTSLFATYGEDHAVIELLCVARILYGLGYLSPEALGSLLFTHTGFASENIVEARALRKQLLATVNGAMAETHL
ncbi:hypothetical protein COU20_00815 [Candidatus Kaiserbacteria bacterium CG10_big_fil_rev_8_21_14_0_10_59_10]|uniref:DNA replication/recombination mediator RecO N-terminal domain-containing protein n=1 Tax=Candidatus Kaiserbacteria bacterium CG10_big_fil_rev_8_21_14_0_10_59_10 TaxID=1974612 RepID=A0A2H0U8H6_9BACT|nr:MAG: hypothetical protein COU20_00815 [Candidatus Kaiserbacteria bacterium CG10_big_fil_rev_8_21_14_0_10_59_10]